MTILSSRSFYYRNQCSPPPQLLVPRLYASWATVTVIAASLPWSVHTAAQASYQTDTWSLLGSKLCGLFCLEGQNSASLHRTPSPTFLFCLSTWHHPQLAPIKLWTPCTQVFFNSWDLMFSAFILPCVPWPLLPNHMSTHQTVVSNDINCLPLTCGHLSALYLVFLI